MIKYGIIGIGNCGGQIVNLASKEMKIDGIAINTSDQDLSEVAADTVKTYLIGDKKGAGQSRTRAKKYLKSDIREITESEDFTKFISGLELIYVVSSTGGGTGSGIAPLLYHMISQLVSVPVILIGVLPTIGEDKGVQENTAKYLKELYEVLDGAQYMLFDNNKGVNLSSTSMMSTINESIVHDIRVLSGFYNHSTKYASIDDRDMITMLSTPGRIVVGSIDEIKEKDLDTSCIEDRIIEDLKKNYHCELDRDKICMNTGIITNLSHKLNDSLNMNIPMIHEFTGEPKGTGFKHIGIAEDDSEPNYVYFIASGLSPVNDRIEKVAQRIHELNEARKDLPKASALDAIEFDDEEEEEKKPGQVNVAEAFKMFGV